jgi:benzodiazapine receptor
MKGVRLSSGVYYSASQVNWFTSVFGIAVLHLVSTLWYTNKLSLRAHKEYEEVRKRVTCAPPSWVFFPIWTVLFVLHMYVWVVWWRHFGATGQFDTVNILFAAVLITIMEWWSRFFETRQYAIAQLVALTLSALSIALVILMFKAKASACGALVPLLVCSVFANYLNYCYGKLDHRCHRCRQCQCEPRRRLGHEKDGESEASEQLDGDRGWTVK